MPLFTWPFSIGSRLISEISMRYAFPHMLGRADFEDKTQEWREEVCFYTQSFVSWISFQMGLVPSLGSSFDSGHSLFQFLGASSMWFYATVSQSGTCLFLVPERHCPPIWDLSFMVPEKHLSMPFWCSAWIFGRRLAYNFLIKMPLFEKVVTTEL